MEDGSHTTEKIWRLALEIIYLLNGETCPSVKSGDHVTITMSLLPSLTPERSTMRKILEAANKITELLIGETGSPFHLNIVGIKEEEEPVMGESAYSGEGRDLCGDMKMEVLRRTPQRSPPLGDYGDGAAGETGRSGQCKEEESSPVIGAGIEVTAPSADEQHTRRNCATCPRISPDCKAEADGPTTASPAGSPSLRDRLPDHHSADPSSTPAGSWGSLPDDSHLVPRHTAERGEITSQHRICTGEKPYSCLECGKCFPFKSALRTHERVHTGEKPYFCPECGKCFSSKSNLVTHERVHTGEKPYSCSECGKCFSHKPDLIKHESLHTGEKPYSCSICGNCFSQKSNLIKHEKIHTGVKPYSCSECGKYFLQKSNLLKHERVHTGEKPYSCSACGKCFYQRSDLIKHQRVHTGERPYSCSECGKSFSVKATLINHEKKYHSRKEPQC